MSNTITVFRVPPLNEFKAAREMRQAGFRAYLPCEKINGRRHPIARGYISGTGKPFEAKHVRQAIGDTPRAQLIRLYPARDRGHVPATAAFAIGDTVEIKVGPFATMRGILTKRRGRNWIIAGTGMKGTVSAHPDNLIRIDPG
jgi:hypothetical protein